MILRITGGALRGQTIKTIQTKLLRPTSSMIREAVFNICQHAIKGSRFLDLFAGSGIMGIEALSRQATMSVFVENDKRLCQLLKDNLHKLNLDQQAQVIAKNVYTALDEMKMSFDIIYIDAPYKYYDEEENFIKKILEKGLKNDLFSSESHIFIEERFVQGKENKYVLLQGLSHASSRKYGSSLLHHYKLNVC